MEKMSGAARREQVLAIAAEEFARSGLHGASVESIARRANITQPYVFRIFGTKQALFLEVMTASFDHLTQGMRVAAGESIGREALGLMGARYYQLLGDRTALLLQLQGFAACGDPVVREAVRDSFGRVWKTIADVTELDPVTIKSFLAFGMLLNNAAALEVSDVDEPWAEGVKTRIEAGLFDHITSETNR